MMKFVTTPSGQRLLLVWRTELLFYTPERRRLAGEWNQVRFTSERFPDQPGLINHNLNQPLPFADELFDHIYTFHVIEHLGPRANERFMRDVHRLLKPGGIYRASTPDLEFFATEYLLRLREQLESASAESYGRYRWAVCNLIDQCAREVSGGEMLEVIRRGEFVPEHVKYMNGDLLSFLFPTPPAAPPPPPPPLMSAEVLKKPVVFLGRVAQALRRRLRPRFSRVSYLELAHERNLWLFDRLSLGRLFAEAGFRNVTAVDYRTSGIPGWDRYNFDQSAFGDYPLEPTLYLEGTK
jgi:predicted SAM-dependent methyltransferase